MWDARAVMRAMDGWVGIDRHTEAGWRQACEEAHQRYHSGRFLIERLGAERFLEPQLMAILWQLRQTLVEEYSAEAPTATMLIDLAVMTYYNACGCRPGSGIWRCTLSMNSLVRRVPRPNYAKNGATRSRDSSSRRASSGSPSSSCRCSSAPTGN